MLVISQEDIDEGKKIMVRNLEAGRIKCFDTKLRFEIKNQGYIWHKWERKTDTFMDCANDFGQEHPEYYCKKDVCRNMEFLERKQLTAKDYNNRSLAHNSSDDLRQYINIDRH